VNQIDPWRDVEQTADGVVRIALPIVNAYALLEPSTGSWVLVDAGLTGTAGAMRRMALEGVGTDAPPTAIVLTHAHFDHVGALLALLTTWDVPVYAHELELPFLTGQAAYPAPDPGVGGGLMARLSFVYPRRAPDLGARAVALPADGSVPGLRAWRWIHTPGHTPGQVALWRESDRTLIAGDAFVTTKQESALSALLKPPAIHGPPAYFTTDWASARSSVEQLAALRPNVAATGHGVPMRGQALRNGLERLTRDFDRLAVPKHGRYVEHPAQYAVDTARLKRS
jgi:glyoxylase-like metal-dependent hydrolase (beta-lactamase superfamily II)